MAIDATKMQEHFGIDLPKVIAEIRLPEPAYERILKVAVSTTVPSLEALMAAIDANDARKVCSTAHELKGVYGNLRIEPLRKLCAEIDARIATGETPASVRALAEKFREQFGVLKKIVDSGDKP